MILFIVNNRICLPPTVKFPPIDKLSPTNKELPILPLFDIAILPIKSILPAPETDNSYNN
jgi:hypothetical protein